MGRAYRIECKSCGTQFMHSTDSHFGVMPTCVGCGGDNYGDESTERAIRCPNCRRRINTTTEEFRQQVVEETIWD